MSLLTERQKLVLLADESEFGWKTVQEYTQHELAEDDQDGKKIRRAEERAEKSLKSVAAKKSKKKSKVDSLVLLVVHNLPVFHFNAVHPLHRGAIGSRSIHARSRIFFLWWCVICTLVVPACWLGRGWAFVCPLAAFTTCYMHPPVVRACCLGRNLMIHVPTGGLHDLMYATPDGAGLLIRSEVMIYAPPGCLHGVLCAPRGLVTSQLADANSPTYKIE